MAKQATKQVDALGFDRFEIANINRAFQANKLIYGKMEKLSEKIRDLAAQYEALEAQTFTWEGPAKQISKNVLGIELPSRDILAFHKDPKLFYEAYPEHELSKAAKAAEAEETPSEAPAQTEEEPF